MAHLLKNVMIIALSLLAAGILAQPAPSVWFVKAGAQGNGTSAESPLGSTETLEAVSRPLDLIIVLSGAGVLDGGIALKSGQTLIGVPQAEQKPVITNTGPHQNGGNGLVLAGDNRIWNIRIENTFASGILGSNVSGNRIEQVEVFGANQSATSTDLSHPIFGEFPHGGILFLNKDSSLSVENFIANVDIVDATAISLVSVATGGAQSRLIVYGSRVEKGSPLNRTDMGILVVADGPSAQTILEIDRSVVQGRTSMGGRNVVALASRQAKTTAVIKRSFLGPVGQDGVLAAATQIPAEVNLDIRESVIENAGQTNIEGTILNLPAHDPARADETNISIRVENCTIRHAGLGDKFEMDTIGNGNIWLGSSAMAQQMDPDSRAPFAPGRYQLRLLNSLISDGKDFGIGFGNVWQQLAPEKSSFEVLLQDNRIMNNGKAEIMIAAPGAHIDARRNCWGKVDGLSEDRIRMLNTAELGQIDTSEPLPCKE